MTFVQKLIKYAAISFGILLIASISFRIMNAVVGVEDLKNVELFDVEFSDTSVTSLEIELKATELEIKKGEKLHAQTNNKDVEFVTKNGELRIKEDGFLSSRKINGKVLLLIPASFFWGEVEIKTGAGLLTVEELSARTLSLTLGAGETKINSLAISEYADIKCGAGKFSLLDASVQNLDLVLGVGEAKIEGDLLGESEVDCGVGELTLTLGKQTDYQVHLEKGLGSIFVNGSEYGGGVYGNGNNKVEIDGGVGRINVKFLADGVNL